MQAQPENLPDSVGPDPSEIPPPTGQGPTTRDSGTTDATRWASFRPGRSLIWFPTLVAALWALVIAVFVGVSISFTEDGGSWGEGLGAVIGNFVVAWVIAFFVSAALRFSRRR